MALPFLQLLELPTSSAACSVILSSSNLRESLFRTGNIHAVVSPDLPKQSLLTALLSCGKIGTKPPMAKRKISPTPPDLGAMERTAQQAGCLQVRTVAAQLRSTKDIRNRLITCAQAVDASGCGGSLLLVSGGHPLRRSHYIETFLPGNSFSMLQTASKLRKAGDLPAGVQLWAVENPLRKTVDRLELKIVAGAEAVILQPPLLRERFENWWEVAHNRGLMKHTRVVVGLPLITSADNLEFWFGLTQTSGQQVDLRLDHLRKMEATLSTVEAKSAFYREETLGLINFIRSLPGVAGIHIMPATPSGWRQLDDLEEHKLEEQIF